MRDDSRHATARAPVFPVGGPLDSVTRVTSALRRSRGVRMVFLALVVGFAGGLCAVAFRWFIGFCQALVWGGGEYSLDSLRSLQWWWLLAVPAAGGLVVGFIAHSLAREVKGHGVPEVMEAVALHGGRIRPRVVLAKLFASGLCIATGGSVGREGPIVQVGATAGSTLGQWLGVGEERIRTLVGCGAAAGISGTFNAPVAGALFAAEVILGDFGVAQFSPIVISAVAGTVVSRAFLGDAPAFPLALPDFVMHNPWELVAYAILGLAAGLAAIALTRTLYFAEDLFDRLPIYPPIMTAIGGLLVGAIALRFPEVLGVGYEAIEEALDGELVLGTLVVLALVKTLSVSITLGTGGSGGVFAPSLFIGAMIGGAVGCIVHGIWPSETGITGTYALVGMGAVVAGATHAPITAIIIIFELTNDYKMMLPLMIGCILSSMLTMGLQRGNIYTLKLLRRGVDLQRRRSVNLLRELRVEEVAREDFVTVREEEPLPEVLRLLVDHPGSALFVTSESHSLLGVIPAPVLRPIVADPGTFGPLIIARDLMLERGFPVVTPDDSLDRVLARFDTWRHEVPVVENGNLVGVVWPEDVIRRYNAELFRRETAATFAAALEHHPEEEPVPGADGVRLAELPVPPGMVGRSLGELDLRKRHRVAVVLVKRTEADGERIASALPDSSTVFEETDVVVLLGEAADIHRLQRDSG